MDVKDKVKTFIRENFLFDNSAQIEDDDSLLEKGIIDSVGVLELVLYLEEEYGVKLEDEEVIPENLDSIANIDNLIRSKNGNMTSTTK
jgi:acyl carrier protein